MSKRISDGERRVTLELAALQGDVAVTRVRIEQLQDMVASLGAALVTLLDKPPFTREPKA
jgi:hypothetical protein